VCVCVRDRAHKPTLFLTQIGIKSAPEDAAVWNCFSVRCFLPFNVFTVIGWNFQSPHHHLCKLSPGGGGPCAGAGYAGRRGEFLGEHFGQRCVSHNFRWHLSCQSIYIFPRAICYVQASASLIAAESLHQRSSAIGASMADAVIALKSKPHAPFIYRLQFFFSTHP
jgi:hypothetical protein